MICVMKCSHFYLNGVEGKKVQPGNTSFIPCMSLLWNILTLGLAIMSAWKENSDIKQCGNHFINGACRVLKMEIRQSISGGQRRDLRCVLKERLVFIPKVENIVKEILPELYSEIVAMAFTSLLPPWLLTNVTRMTMDVTAQTRIL